MGRRQKVRHSHAIIKYQFIYVQMCIETKLDLRRGSVSYFADNGCTLVTGLDSYCEYRTQDGVSKYYLSTPFKNESPYTSTYHNRSIFFNCVNQDDTAMEYVLLSDTKGNSFHLSREDTIPSHRNSYRSLNMSELQDNVLIPNPVSFDPACTSKVDCPNSEMLTIRPHELCNLLVNTSDFSLIYASIMIETGNRIIEILGKVNTISFNSAGDRGSGFFEVTIKNSLIPLFDYPYYGQFNITIPIVQGSPQVTAIVPAYHAEPYVSSTLIVKQHKTYLSYPATVTILQVDRVNGDVK